MAKILVVDQEQQVRKLLGAVLGGAGHEVHLTADPNKALEMCSVPGGFDLVLSEVALGEMDGHELARRIAVRCPESRVVLISAVYVECQDCPYHPRCSHIPKPFDPRELLSEVGRVIGQRRKPS